MEASLETLTSPRSNTASWPRPRRLRWILLGAAILLVVAGAALADAYLQAYRVYRDIEPASTELSAARDQLSTGKIPDPRGLARAERAADRAKGHVDHARPTFGLVGALPWLGRPVDAARLASVAAFETTRAAVIGRDAAANLLGEGSRPPAFDQGTIDVARLSSLGRALDRMTVHLEAAGRALRAIPNVPLAGRLAAARDQAVAASDEALRLVRRARAVMGFVPAFFGAEHPRTYFLALQNNADLRGTGGAVLAFAFVSVADGRITLDQGGPIGDVDMHRGVRGVDLPAAVDWYLRNAQVNPRIANGANYSPDFPVVGSALARMLIAATGRRVDGLIAIDPPAVAHVLKDSPPFTIPSYPRPIDAGNVVFVTENDQNRLPPADREAFPGQVVAAAFTSFLHTDNLYGTLEELGAALAENRIQIWSRSKDEQAVIHSLGWSGALDPGDGDFLALADDKRSGNKVDYYTHTAMRYRVALRGDGSAAATFRVTLDNRTPPGQPFPIAQQDPYGVNVAMLNLYVPGRALFQGVEPVAGPGGAHPPGFAEHEEGDLRVFTQTIVAAPGEPVSVTFRYDVPGAVQPSGDGHVYELRIHHQPLVNAADLTVSVRLPPGVTLRSAPGWTVRNGVATFHGALRRNLVLRITW